MEAFNIRIPMAKKEMTLTILPEPESASYKIVYNGGILGAIRQQKSHWLAVGQHKVNPGPLPLYDQKFGEGSCEIDLDHRTVSKIGSEIVGHLEEQLELEGQR